MYRYNQNSFNLVIIYKQIPITEGERINAIWLFRVSFREK